MRPIFRSKCPTLPRSAALGFGLSAALILGCGGEKALQCGDGTTEVDGECVAAEADADADSDADADADSDADSDADADADSDADADADSDADADTDADVDRVVVGYFIEWGVYDRGFEVEDIPVADITHLNYAFVNISPEGECVVYDSWAALERSGGNFARLQALKAANPHLRTLISVGGWTLSGRFPAVAATPESRARFASSCVDFMLTYGFDGIDVDWEYPVSGGLTPGGPEDTANYTLLLAALRAELDAAGPGHLLTIAGPAGPEKIANIDIPGVAASVDWVNVMTYDYHGGWETSTHFNAPLDAGSDFPLGVTDPLNLANSVEVWRAGGLPAHQLTIGLPLYGRGWAGAGATNNGLFQRASGLSAGTWEAGVLDAWDVLEGEALRADCTRHWHEVASVPWLYCTDGTFITYDDHDSLAAKAQLAVDEDLRGVMFWSMDADVHSGDTLIQAAANVVR